MQCWVYIYRSRNYVKSPTSFLFDNISRWFSISFTCKLSSISRLKKTAVSSVFFVVKTHITVNRRTFRIRQSCQQACQPSQIETGLNSSDIGSKVDVMSAVEENELLHVSSFYLLIPIRRNFVQLNYRMMTNISESTVTNAFISWMYVEWKSIKWWPSRELVKFFLPTDMGAKFPNTHLIVDVTEIPIKPKAPLEQQANSSTYKTKIHNTCRNHAS